MIKLWHLLGVFPENYMGWLSKAAPARDPAARINFIIAGDLKRDQWRIGFNAHIAHYSLALCTLLVISWRTEIWILLNETAHLWVFIVNAKRNLFLQQSRGTTARFVYALRFLPVWRAHVNVSHLCSSILNTFRMKHITNDFVKYLIPLSTGVCTNATAPSVSSINRILRNRAAERAAAEFARAAGYGLYAAPSPYGAFPWGGGGGVWPPGSLPLPPGVPVPPSGVPHPDAVQQGFLSSSGRGLIGKRHSILVVPIILMESRKIIE